MLGLRSPVSTLFDPATILFAVGWASFLLAAVVWVP